MEMFVDFMLYVGILSAVFAPCVICCWFFEETSIGRRLWDFKIVPWLIKHDILPDDRWDSRR